MKTGNIIIKITVIIGTVLSMLVGRVKSSGEGGGRLSNICGYTHKYILSSTIVSETDKLRLEDYRREGIYYTFIKNLLMDGNDELNSKNIKDTIVVENDKKFDCYYSYVYTCFYIEVEENGKIKKKCIPYKETTGKEKKILVALKHVGPKFMAQLKEAKNRIANPEEGAQIKEAIELMKRMLNQTMYRFYTKNDSISNVDPDIKHIKSLLENIGMAKTAAYSLFSRAKISNIQSNLANLFRDFETIVRNIKKMPYKDDLFDSITENNEKEIKRIFSENSRRIATQIMNRKQNYDGKTVEKIQKDFCNDLMMFINILTDERIETDFHMYISKEELNKEIENIEDKEIKRALHEIVDEYPIEYNRKLSIGKLRSKINNSNGNPFHSTERKKTESSTSKETKEKANEMLDRIKDSEDVEIHLKTHEIVKEAKKWNRDLASLMCSLTMEYIKFNGTKEKLIEDITAHTVQIASETLISRQEKYTTYKSVFTIQKIVDTELKQIMRIIEDTAKLERHMAANANEQIVALLEIISNKSEDATEEEKQVIKALEYISEGKHNSEEEQKIKEVLDKIVRKEYTPEEQKEKNTQRHIRSILSEIAEEFIKDEDYQVTYKTINNKKQEIVNIVVEKLSIVNEHKYILKIKEIFRDIVDIIADILIDNAIDRTQHKGLKTVEEEIENEAGCIKSQGLTSSFSWVSEFITKYANLDSNGHVFLYGFDNSFTHTYITRMINIYIREHNETVNVLPFNGSYKKLVDFLCIVNILCKIDEDIDNFKTYSDFWLNPTSFYYCNEVMNPNHKSNSAAIDYKNTIKEKIQAKTVLLTDDSLQAFRRARTIQDIENIQSEYPFGMTETDQIVVY